MAQTIAELKDNRKQKNLLLQQLLELSQLEKAQLEADEVEELADTTKRWQKLAEEINRLDAAYKSTLAPLQAQGGDSPLGAHAAEFTQMEAEGRDLLKCMQQLQIDCNTLAAEKTEQYKTNLKDAQKSNQRVNSYANPYSISEDGIYFDQKK